MREAGVRAAKAIGYDSAGTIECLVSGDEFYFLEMNTRIQVEHTVTEMITGLDLVREQIRVAAGEPLGYAQATSSFADLRSKRASMPRIRRRTFAPLPGTIAAYREPGGPGVRVDSAAYAGWTIPAEYDSLVAKLVVWAPTRERAIARLRRAIDEYVDRRRPDDASARCARSATIPASSMPPTGPQRSKRSRDLAPVRRRGTVAAANDAVRSSRGRTPAGAAVGVAAATSRERERQAASWSPMHGLIVEIRVTPGDRVAEGQVVAVIEAMKMMNEIRRIPRRHGRGGPRRGRIERRERIAARNPRNTWRHRLA